MADGGTDDELEKLKARRLAEMQKNLQAQRAQEAEETRRADADGAKKQATPRDLVVASLGFRGLEVLECAEAQYPREAPLVVGRIAEIMRSEGIAEQLDGGQLMEVFRMLGMPIRIKTSIKIQEDGKMVSLSDKLRSSSSSSSRRNDGNHGGPES